jgi:DsbC/DsbD-like thiol-disulfide interchange protein/cytochrome c biogenesis protein CcdA
MRVPIRPFMLLRLIWMALVLAFAAQVHARDNNISARLVAEGPAQPGQTLTLAIQFNPAEGWHGYWANPGDAGYGMELAWTLPEGWEAGEPQYPVPQTLMLQGLMNHVYEGPYAVLVPITVPADADGGPVEIGLDAQWLACTDKICVPEQATLSTITPVGTDPDERFDLWRAAIPPLLDRIANFAVADGTLRIGIPIPAAMALSEPHVFIRNEDLVRYAEPQGFTRKGDMLVVEILLSEWAEQPVEVSGILSLGGGNGVRFRAGPGKVPYGGEPLASTGKSSAMPPGILLLFLGALAGGLILNIMPCVFPILSLKALTLARVGESEAQARREGLAYTAGVILACLALGGIMLALRAAGEQVGWAFQLQEPWVVVLLLILAVAITANFAGLFELPNISLTQSGEPASAFATGLLAAFVATPCTGPFMAAALGAALLLPVPQALLLFGALGLGLALPFLLIGLFPPLRKMLPRPGPWMEKFRKAMAIPMGLTALALVWLVSRLGGKDFALVALVVVLGIVIGLAVTGRLQRGGKLAWPAFGLIVAPFLLFGAFALPSSYAQPPRKGAVESILPAVAFSQQALAAARASGKPVFLWFTADWCLTCKVNEGVAIEREATREAFEKAGVIPMVGDWTQRDAEITAFLAEQGAAGVPLYLWYEPGEGAEQLPQVLTADELTELAQRLR